MNACILLVLCLKGCLNYRFLLGPNLFVKKGKKKSKTPRAVGGIIVKLLLLG